jgi:hypothetical protein
MLMGRGRVAVPGIVRHIDEHGCLPQYLQLLAAEGILVANGEAELLSRGAQDGLARRTCGEVIIGKAHQTQPATHEGRHRKIFAKRHQVPLVVPTRAGAAKH